MGFLLVCLFVCLFICLFLFCFVCSPGECQYSPFTHFAAFLSCNPSDESQCNNNSSNSRNNSTSNDNNSSNNRSFHSQSHQCQRACPSCATRILTNPCSCLCAQSHRWGLALNTIPYMHRSCTTCRKYRAILLTQQGVSTTCPCCHLCWQHSGDSSDGCQMLGNVRAAYRFVILCWFYLFKPMRRPGSKGCLSSSFLPRAIVMYLFYFVFNVLCLFVCLCLYFGLVCLCLFVCLLFYLRICSVCLSLTLCLSFGVFVLVRFSVYLTNLSLCLCLSVCLSDRPSVCPSAFLLVCLSVC